mmetsp:Transcript_6611/g.19503  ORF Transcript_6611/g.19503 Transcript_6611/m.19503 type:complete len:86 (-) Transcript_6611:551-808(-)
MALPFDFCMRAASGMIIKMYVGIQNATDFTIGGVLGDFNVTARSEQELGADLPILLTMGKYDTMRPPIVDVMERAIPTVECVTAR